MSFRLEGQLNELLVETFNIILKAEENAIKGHDGIKISISEMHLIEAVGKGGTEKTVSAVAQDLGITLPSVTIAIQKLEKKGYLIRSKSVTDGRSVLVSLTDKGRETDEFHKSFHAHMVNSVSGQLSEEEREVLCHAVSKLNTYFKRVIKLTQK